ncbi:MAG: putative quinol monooxygenase, partial [Thiotrichaceae bacterium]|nr:putative quinol monooxygenase [Thiotrichaceae bacterium]
NLPKQQGNFEMSTVLTIIARIEAVEDKIELVKTELTKLIEPTLKETGCIQYDLHQDNDNPAVFLFYENWQNRDLWQQHISNVHLAEYMQATDGAIASFVVSEMTKQSA